MVTGSSDSPRAEAAAAQEAVCTSDSASPKAARSHCSRLSVHKHHDEQQRQQSSQLRRRRRGPVRAVRAVGSKVQHSISRRHQQLQDLEKDLLCLRMFNEILPDQVGRRCDWHSTALLPCLTMYSSGTDRGHELHRCNCRTRTCACNVLNQQQLCKGIRRGAC
jgi:hypothetical protein